MNEIETLALKLKNIIETRAKWQSDYALFNEKDISEMIHTIALLIDRITEFKKIHNYNKDSTAVETSTKEMVNHPSHYNNGKIECIDAMLDVFGKDKVLAFCELNAFKYQWRANQKGTDIQDKQKSIWYLNKYLELKDK